MKSTGVIFILFISTLCKSCFAQTFDLYGIWYDSTETSHFVSVNAMTGQMNNINTLPIPPATVPAHNTSLIVADSSYYFYTAYDVNNISHYYIIEMSNGNLTYDVPGDYTFLPHIYSDTIYALLFESGDYSLVAINYSSGQTTNLNQLPAIKTQLEGVLNPTTDEFIILGSGNTDPAGTYRYFTIDLSSYTIVHDTVAQYAFPNVLQALEIDTSNNVLYGLMYDGNNYHFVTVDHFTGEYTTISTLSDVESVWPGTDVFNPYTGQFIFRGKKFSDPSGTNRYYVINASDGTIASDAIAEGDVRLLELNPNLNPGIKPTQNPFSFSLHPNPANDKVSISLPEEITNGKLQLANIQGRVIMEETLNKNNSQINVAGIPAGLYFVILSDDADRRAARKLIKINTEQ